jgi:hypothetical protein
MRSLTAVLLLVLLSLSIACSYGTDLVVVNETAQAIEVRYRVKRELGSPLSVTGVPKTASATSLGSRSAMWQALSADRYQVDRSEGTIRVSLMPGEVLRIVTLTDYDSYDDTLKEEFFPFEEITIMGTGGRQQLTGTQARKAFVKVSSNLYTLTYR